MNTCLLFILDFSLTAWMKEQEINLGQKLPRYAVDLLAEELGIAGYLQEGQCTRAAYQPDKHGWNATGNNLQPIFTTFRRSFTLDGNMHYRYIYIFSSPYVHNCSPIILLPEQTNMAGMQQVTIYIEDFTNFRRCSLLLIHLE